LYCQARRHGRGAESTATQAADARGLKAAADSGRSSRRFGCL